MRFRCILKRHDWYNEIYIHMGPTKFNVEFQVLDINTNYKLLLERPWVNMVEVNPSTIHQLKNFIWNDKDLVFQGDGVHSNGYVPIVDDVPKDCDVYTMKLENIIGDNLDLLLYMPHVYKMIASVMLESCL